MGDLKSFGHGPPLATAPPGALAVLALRLALHTIVKQDNHCGIFGIL